MAKLVELYEKRASFEAMRSEKQRKIDEITERTKDAKDDDLGTLEKQAADLAAEIAIVVKEEAENEKAIEGAEALLKTAAAAVSVSKEKNVGTQDNYLKTKGAMEDFAEVISAHEGKNLADVNKAWADHLTTKGVTNPELLYPEPLVQAIKDRFEASGTIFATLNKHYGFTVWSNMMNIATGDDTRARGHQKGKDKKEQVITLDRKVARSDYIYKYITLDKKDIREAQANGAALISYILSELPQRIVTEIERAVVIGDGRAAGSDDKIASFEAIVDADVGVYITKTAGTNNLFDDIVLAEADILAAGSKYMVINKKTLAKLKIARDNTGALLYPMGTDFASLFGVSQIFTPEWFVESTTVGDPLAVIWAGDAYDFVGDQTIEQYQNFILQKNKEEYLAELYCGGALLTADSGAVITVPPAG